MIKLFAFILILTLPIAACVANTQHQDFHGNARVNTLLEGE